MTVATIPSLNGAVHPAADVFPLIEGEDFASLVDSIREHGLLEPLWILPDGTLLDGRNRLRACSAAGVVPELRVYEGGDPVGFVVAENVKRRHLSKGQQAVLADAVLPMRQAEAHERKTAGTNQYSLPANLPGGSFTGESREAAVSGLDISPRTLSSFQSVKQDAPDLVPAIAANELTIHAAQTIATEAPDLIPAITTGEVTPAEAATEARERKKAHVANNSGENEWYTPTVFVEAARTAMGSIDTDPASSEIAQRTVQADTYYTKDTNGLEQNWHGNVWINPPYAQPLIGQFVEKLVDEFTEGRLSQAVVLVNNGTETRWGQTLLGLASAVCFPSSRIRFLDPDGKPGAPLQGQMIVYIGPRRAKFHESFHDIGAVVYG